MNISEQVRLLRQSKHVHSNWYRETYPEVARLNIEPALHYLRYGAAMGRNPGKHFNTRFYLHTYPDAAQSGMNPLLHYVLHGKDKGYVIRPPQSPGAKHVATLRTKLLSLGFTERPLQELADLHANADAPETRALAARELALWHMRLKTPEGYRRALAHLAAARADAPDLDFRRKLAVAELLCHHFLDDGSEGRACYERAALAGEASPDLWLSRANIETRPEGRLALMNRVLRHYDIPPIALLPGETLSPYDRLTSAGPLDAVTEGPKVTVLIAAYDAADMLPTALRSLQEQTWKNLEIIVLDDCSPSSGTIDVAQRFAKGDPRIRVIRMDQNGGAYVARNRGLDEATGDYVTLHDADDWSHPKKIETQVRFMEENPAVMGCTSEQARCEENMIFSKLRSGGGFIVFNTSSFLWRRVPVTEALGYWDTVRFGADNEFIRRMQKVFGNRSFKKIPTGPLSFQREANSSITTDPIKGLDGGGSYYGVRKDYFEAQKYHHATATSLKYDNNRSNRPFPVPPMMMVPGSEAYQRNFDIIICSDFREDSPYLDELHSLIEKAHEDEKSVGLVEYNLVDNGSVEMADSIRALIVDGKAAALVYGEVGYGGEIIKVGYGVASRLSPEVMAVKCGAGATSQRRRAS